MLQSQRSVLLPSLLSTCHANPICSALNTALGRCSQTTTTDSSWTPQGSLQCNPDLVENYPHTLNMSCSSPVPR
ncbi:hypothetical protein ASPZODRAFT_135255 [Penicilliopsis zonata CBS 506.65]|uniref:Uncharacterized protein n=1 Tax=Penicilliopsis zonata CBS 506.65 TaxID=1073090 RepID=A0A1L9SB70_9EURO|nr:hypothetical protein ASPZODRAFT_135255 [Penicilliopsis zonata CBS 506.65]OJJ44430.1 hypothetical protein ASPZODRAFT_135255 [Penicilliopsis zonata CBS 506.65]